MCDYTYFYCIIMELFFLFKYEFHISITNGQWKQRILASCIVSRLILYYLNSDSINFNSYHKFISVLLFDQYSFADIFLILLITNVLLVKLMMHQQNQKHESCSEASTELVSLLMIRSNVSVSASASVQPVSFQCRSNAVPLCFCTT